MNKKELVTPCYIIHEDILEDGIALLKDSLQTYWNNYCIGYSFKTNSLPWIVERMKKEGFFAEVVSEDEYFLALKHGYKDIIYNGPVKGRDSFMDALNRGAIINLDAKRELWWLKQWLEASGEQEKGKKAIGQQSVGERTWPMIGLRVNFNLESMVPGETSGAGEGSRFGFSYETGELKEAMDELNAMGIKVAGLHLHTSSKTRSVAIYRALAKKACELKREYNLQLSYIDMGGGYFGGMDNRPRFPDYVKAMKEELEAAFTEKETMLILEPGTSVITPPVEYLTTVTDVRQTYANRIVTTDGSRIDVDPLHTKKSYFYNIIPGEEWEDRIWERTGKAAVFKKQVICGFTCMENDRLFVAENERELKQGDRISFQKVGGYTMCLTPLFIRYFPNVYVESKGRYRLVRKAWGPEEYSAGSL